MSNRGEGEMKEIATTEPVFITDVGTKQVNVSMWLNAMFTQSLPVDIETARRLGSYLGRKVRLAILLEDE